MIKMRVNFKVRDLGSERARSPARRIWEGVYLFEIARGLWHTLVHFFSRKFTVEYDGTEPGNPRKNLRIPGYRGEHYLKRDEQGGVKCVACYMCATACPAKCIHIEAAAAPAGWPARDKYPARFEIDLLRCIFCGCCEEACPVDAIALSGVYPQVAASREEKVYNRDRLLANGEALGAAAVSKGPTEGEHRGPWLDRDYSPATEKEGRA